MQISKKTSAIGFEWGEFYSLWEKVNEEMNELKLAIKNKDFANAELLAILFSQNKD